MKVSSQTFRRGALGIAPVGLPGLGSRILAGVAALLLMSVALGGRAWAITGGQVDTNNTYSNVGALVALPPGESPLVFCSGVLIHPRVLLTAGHGTEMLVQYPWRIPLTRVSFGTYAFDPGTWREIEAVITHPNYDPIHNQSCYDVGVIILKEPVYDVPLAKLPYAGFLDDLKKAGLLRKPGQGGAPFIVAGYGSTLAWPPPVTTDGDGWRRFAYSDYLGLTPGWLYLLQNLATGSAGTGIGDSGGPAFWVTDDGSLVLVGLTGHGDPKLVATGIDWRVDLPGTLDFIAQVIQGLEP